MALTLSVRREGETMDVQMTPVQTQEGDYKLGLWIRDDTQGIGTMTYVCANGAFGALGHGISDGDTGRPPAANYTIRRFWAWRREVSESRA